MSAPQTVQMRRERRGCLQEAGLDHRTRGTGGNGACRRQHAGDQVQGRTAEVGDEVQRRNGTLRRPDRSEDARQRQSVDVVACRRRSLAHVPPTAAAPDHQARKALVQVGGRQAESLQGARPKTFQEDVRPLQQREQRLSALLCLEVQRDRRPLGQQRVVLDLDAEIARTRRASPGSPWHRVGPEAARRRAPGRWPPARRPCVRAVARGWLSTCADFA